MMTARLLDRIGLFFVALVIVSPAILFFLWMISLSLKFEIDNGAYPPILIPETLRLVELCARCSEENNFFLYLWNSVLVTGAATLLALLIGVPAGYGIARLKAEKSAVVIMIARMTPGLSYLIPLFLLFQWIGMVGTLLAADHHPSGGHRADRRVGHDRLFRDDADGTGGSRQHRRRQFLAGVPAGGAADRQARASSSP